MQFNTNDASPLRAPAWACLSGLLLSLSFPNALFPDLSPARSALAWLALVPLFQSLQGVNGPGRAFRLGWTSGFLFFGLHCLWIPRAWPVGWPAWMTWAGLAGYGALYPALFSAGYAWLRQRRQPLEALWVPALWTLTEAIRETLFTGIPGYSLGSSQAMNPWVLPLAGVLGVAGLHFAVCLGNLGLHRALTGAWQPREGLVALGAGALLLALGALAPATASSGPFTKVALVQGSVHAEKLAPAARADESMRVYSELSIDAMFDGAKLLIWPEGEFPEDLAAQGPRGMAIADFARRRGLNLLIGSTVGLGPGKGKANDAVFIDTKGRQNLYQKRHLIPFGEYMPFKELHPLFRKWAEHFDLLQMQAGNSEESFLAGGLRLSPAICYESLFGGELRKRQGGLLVVMANDAWFQDSATPNYHLMHSMLRAVEGGRYVAHAVAEGPSALIGPDGRIIRQLPLGARALILGDVDGRCDSNYIRWGWAFPWFCALLLAAPGLLRRRG